MGAHTPEVVDGQLLAAVLQRWTVKFLAERPLRHVGTGEQISDENGSAHFVGPVAWLAQESGLNVRTCSGLCNGEWQYVSLSRADAVLTAIGKNYMLGDSEDSEIPVVRNPVWSQERWVAYMSKRGCI